MKGPAGFNPFVGLRPFEREDSLLYFGRGAQVKSLLELLERGRFLAVVGSSGCGKSSLIRAGLIPALEAGFLAQDRDRWRVATLKPGEAPLRHLASALQSSLGEPSGDSETLIERMTEEGAPPLLDLCERAEDAASTNLLLLVDQFEELFRFGLTREDPAARGQAEAFVALLLRLAEQRRFPVYACMTMRSDFLGDCDAFIGLPEAINRGQFLVPRLTRAQRREAIEGPIRLAEGSIAPRLVDCLLNENLDTRDDLPILQHLLLRVWDAWSESPDAGPMDLAHYDRVQGIHRALDWHAQEALEELSDPDRTLARRLFQTITELDPGNRRIRRAARLSEIQAVAGAGADRVMAVIERFRAEGRNFLVLSSPNPEDDPLIDISHESLIRQWETLRDWVDQEADSAKLYRRLSETAALEAKGKAGLYREADLEQAMDWQRINQPSPAWAQRYPGDFGQSMRFLERSREARDEEERQKEQAHLERERLMEEKAQLAEQQARLEREAKRKSQRWALAMGALACLMLAVAVFGWYSWNEADRQKTQARAATERAEAQFLAASVNLAKAHEEKAVGILNKPAEQRTTGDYQRALLQALEAQHQQIGDELALRLSARDRLLDGSLEEAFSQRWASPSLDSSSSINSVAFSPDGRLLASASYDGTVRLWDPSTGKPLHSLQGHEGSATSVAFSPDGKLLASASWDKTVRLWDPATGRAVRILEGHGDWVSSVAFSPDGKLLASASADKTLRLWDPATGAPVRTLEGHEDPVFSVAFSPDSKLLASASSDKMVRLWDSATGKPLRTLVGHGDLVYSVAFSSDGKLLASASRDKSARLWNPVTGAQVRNLEGHGDSVSSVAFSPDGKLLASASWDKTVRLWNPTTGKAVRILEGYGGLVYSIAFSPDGKLLASASRDKSARLWNPTTGKPSGRLEGHRNWVNSVAFSPDGKLLASASYDKTVCLWDPANGKPLRTLEGHGDSVSSVAFSPDGKLLASASGDKTLRLWDPATGKSLRTMDGHSDWVYSVAFSPDGNLLASASGDKSVRLWDPATGEHLRTLEGHRDWVSSVAFSRPDGKLLASGSWDKTVRLWDPATAKPLGLLGGHGDPVSSVAVSPDGKLLASASRDNTARVWDLATGKPLLTLEGNRGPITSVAFSPDGKLLASASYDKTVRLWDPITGKTLRTLKGHETSVNSVAFSPNGNLLASASRDKSVRLWDMRTLRLLWNGSAPSIRAALISETLQRLWGLRVNGLEIVPESWRGQPPHDGYYVDQEITIPVGSATRTANGSAEPEMRTFNIRPLLDPPKPGEDKLDQLLRWLDEQDI